MSLLALTCVDSSGQFIGCEGGGVVYSLMTVVLQMFSLILDYSV